MIVSRCPLSYFSSWSLRMHRSSVVHSGPAFLLCYTRHPSFRTSFFSFTSYFFVRDGLLASHPSSYFSWSRKWWRRQRRSRFSSRPICTRRLFVQTSAISNMAVHVDPSLAACSALCLLALFAFSLSHPWSSRYFKRRFFGWPAARQMNSFVVLPTPASRATGASLVIQLLNGLSHLSFIARVLFGMPVLPRVIVELLLVLLHDLTDPLFPALSVSRDLNPFLAPLMLRVSQLLHDLADPFPVHAPQAAFLLFVSRTDAENHSFAHVSALTFLHAASFCHIAEVGPLAHDDL